MSVPGSGTLEPFWKKTVLMASSLLPLISTTENVRNAIPGSLAIPMKMALPSPFEFELPASLKQLPFWSQTVAMNAPKKSAWIWAPAAETGVLKTTPIGPALPVKLFASWFQINQSPGVKFPAQLTLCCIEVKLLGPTTPISPELPAEVQFCGVDQTVSGGPKPAQPMLSLGATQATVVQRIAANEVVETASKAHSPKMSESFFMFSLSRSQ